MIRSRRTAVQCAGDEAGRRMSDGQRFGMPNYYDQVRGKAYPGQENGIMGAPGNKASERDIERVLRINGVKY